VVLQESHWSCRASDMHFAVVATMVNRLPGGIRASSPTKAGSVTLGEDMISDRPVIVAVAN
jgi:hypothetical protein